MGTCTQRHRHRHSDVLAQHEVKKMLGREKEHFTYRKLRQTY